MKTDRWFEIDDDWVMWAEEAYRVLGKLSEGINPFSKDPPDESDTLNDPQVRRAYFVAHSALRKVLPWFGSRILEKEIAEEWRLSGIRYKYVSRLHSNIQLEDKPVRLEVILENLKNAYGKSCTLEYVDLENFLLEKEVLIKNPEYLEGEQNIARTVANPKFQDYGIWTAVQYNADGARCEVTYYTKAGQSYVLNNLLGKSGLVWKDQKQCVLNLFAKIYGIAYVDREMDEEHLEKLKKTKKAMDYLAKGINPFTGEMAGKEDTLNNVQICRTLSFTSVVLREAIPLVGFSKAKDATSKDDMTGGNSIKKAKQNKSRPKKIRFKYKEDLHEKINIEANPISLSQIVLNIKQAYGDTCKLTYRDLRTLLSEKGVLIDNPDREDGGQGVRHRKSILNPKANILGIQEESRVSSKGTNYIVIVYDPDGQKYVLDLLKEVGTIIQ